MRIVAGRFKGRRLAGPGAGVRPTSDAMRETLFNVLDVPADARVLDACAGTGALGLEALSRGAGSVTFVERDARAIDVIRRNVRLCGAEDACAIIRGDLRTRRRGSGRPSWAREPFDLVLLDPPYDVDDVGTFLDAAVACLASPGVLVFEHSRRRDVPHERPGARRTRLVTAGDSAISFYASAGALS